MFQLEIITPEQVFYKARISSLIAPQMEGYFGVLASHAPLIARSTGGKIIAREEGRPEKKFQIGPGIIEVHKNRVVVLTHEAHFLNAS